VSWIGCVYSLPRYSAVISGAESDRNLTRHTENDRNRLPKMAAVAKPDLRRPLQYTNPLQEMCLRTKGWSPTGTSRTRMMQGVIKTCFAPFLRSENQLN